jgi:hypothetical protein
MITSLIKLGAVARSRRDVSEARLELEEGLALARKTGNAYLVGYGLAELACLARLHRDFDAAERYLTEAIRTFRPINERLPLVLGLGNLGVLTVEQGGSLDRGVRLIAAATAIDELFVSALDPDERLARDAALGSAQEVLGAAAFARAWAKGQAMTLKQAVAYTLEEDGS